MATTPTPAPGNGPTAGDLRRIVVVPAIFGGLALAVAGSLGYVWIGLLVLTGLALGTVNGVLAQAGMARVGPTGDRGVVINNSLRRLGAITAVALVIAWLARPVGWTVLVGLAVYQLLALGSTIGAAMREARGA